MEKTKEQYEVEVKKLLEKMDLIEKDLIRTLNEKAGLTTQLRKSESAKRLISRDEEKVSSSGDSTNSEGDMGKALQGGSENQVKVLPILIQNLSFQDTLNSRLVCQEWKKAIDEYYQTEELHCKIMDQSRHFDEHEEKDSFSRFKIKTQEQKLKFPQHYTFRSASSLQDFIQKLDDGKINPFITRKLVFVDEAVRKDDSYEFWRVVVEAFLPKFGSHIRYCTFKFYAEHQTLTTVYLSLLYSLKHLPNLINLTVINHDMKKIPDYKLQSLGLDQLIESQSFSLAPLKSLKVLSLYNLDPTILSQLWIDSIVKLKIIDQWGMGYGYDADQLELENLEQLYIDGNGYIEALPNYLFLHTLTFDNWVCLKTLISHCAKIGLGPNIRTLDISLNTTECSEEYLETCRLDFPRLTTFRMFANGPHFKSLDFIIGLTSLKVLCLCLRDLPEKPTKNLVDPGQILKFGGFFDRMYESNIWELMPNLETFYLKTTEYYGSETTCRRYFRSQLP